MNDSVVCRSTIKAVLNQEAYLLFYVRWERLLPPAPLRGRAGTTCRRCLAPCHGFAVDEEHLPPRSC